MKNKKTIALFLIFIIIVLSVFSEFYLKNNIKDQEIPNTDINNGIDNIAKSPKDANYIINGRLVKLTNGLSIIPIATSSASDIIVEYFGNEVEYDFNKDGRLDNAFILTESTGGSGIFYYLVVALNTSNGYIGSDGFFLGDRIAPQTTVMGKGSIIIVNYADRKAGESFAIPPSIGKSKWILLEDKTMRLGEVAVDFKGEADPSIMKLDMKKWIWINTVYNNDEKVIPKIEGKFTLTFKDSKTFSASTDCNGVGGEYTLNGNNIVFDRMMSTLMYCEGSQEKDFTGVDFETGRWFSRNLKIFRNIQRIERKRF